MQTSRSRTCPLLRSRRRDDAPALEPLDAGLYREIVRRALAEDFGWGDVTTETIIERDQTAHGVILAKSPCVVAGLDIASEAFRQMDPGVVVTFTAA